MDWSTALFIIFISCVGSILSGFTFLIFGKNSLNAAKWLFPAGVLGTIAIGLFTSTSSTPPTSTQIAVNTCRDDYRACSSQDELVDTYRDMVAVRTSCKRAARKLARYGDADIPFFAFEAYFPYEGSAKSGQISLVEDNARYQNGFGAMEHVKLKCVYDLDRKEVVEIISGP